MCSLNDEEDSENYLLEEKPSSQELATCRSCSNKALVVLRKKDAYCRDCFLASETHKFRAALGKTKLMKPQDKVLVACSGNMSSMALLHLLKSGVTEKHHKKLLFEVYVLFVEEGFLFNMSTEERINAVNNVTQIIEEYNFPTFITSLSECFSDAPEVNSELKINPDKDEQLLKLFDNLESVTSKEDLLYVLKRKLILKVAASLKCNKLFTTEVGNDLAVKLLTNFSLGRGEQASFETGFTDTRVANCTILRPLRDFLMKEIVFYNQFCNVKSSIPPTFTTKSPTNVSIQKLSEKFITDLQVDFPATVYTIFRTGEKLSTNATRTNEDKFCLLCDDSFRTRSNKDFCAVDALNMSWNTPKGSCEKGNKENCCGSCATHNESESGTRKTVNFEELKKNFCFGCGGILSGMASLNYLPKDVIQSALERKNLEQMKEQISEFLLPGT